MDIKQPIKRQSLVDIEQQAARVAAMMGHIRAAMLPPSAKKSAPFLSAAQLAQLCNVEKSKVAYRLTREDLPPGEMHGNRREWSMEDSQVWARALRPMHMRPQGAAAVTITVANFKGGVAKTTTAVTLA